MRKRYGFTILGPGALVALLFACALGCGGGSSSGGGAGSVAVSGTLGTGFSPASGASMAASPRAASDNVVNRITALPNFAGVVNASSITQAKTATVAPDGSFSLSLDKDKNWILVLEDTESPSPGGRFVGYVALKVDSASSLLSLPISSASASSIDLGNISKEAGSDTGITDNNAQASDFTLTAGELGTLARTDDLFKSVKNLIVNYSEATGSYVVPMPIFEFRGVYDNMDNAFASASDYAYRAYQINVLPNMPGFTMNGVCGSGQARVRLALYPPAGASVTDRLGTITYDMTHPIENDYAECSTASDGATEADEPSSPPVAGSGDFYASNREASLGFPVTVEFGRGGGDGLVGPVPAGYWRYEVDNVVVGRFDIAVASPWVGGYINAPVPVLKVNRDAETGLIGSIDIKWYRPNDARTGYVEVTEIGMLKQLVEFTVVELENYLGADRRYEHKFVNASTVTSYTPESQWYWRGTHPADPTLEATGIHISYGSGGVNLFFSNHKP